MLRTFAKFWAHLSYLWSLEVEGHKNDVNAATAKRNAVEKRALVAQLNAEADAIEANVKQVEAEEEERHKGEEYLKLADKEKYEDQQASKKEKDAALQM